MKLYVDDVRPAPDDTWTVARTNTQAIAFLHQGLVTQISLDHDIMTGQWQEIGGVSIWNDGCSAETFRPVAYYLAIMPSEDRPWIRFHTANFDGGREMAKIIGVPYLRLPEAERDPEYP